MTTVMLPPDPDFVCWMALVTSSEISKVAASESTSGIWDAARRTKSRTRDTCRGCPGIVIDPSTIEPLPSRCPSAVDFIRFPSPELCEYASALNETCGLCPNCADIVYYLGNPSALSADMRTIMSRKFITRKCMREILQMKSHPGFHLALCCCIVQLVKTARSVSVTV
jgi:hypothetical protein